MLHCSRRVASSLSTRLSASRSLLQGLACAIQSTSHAPAVGLTSGSGRALNGLVSSRRVKGWEVKERPGSQIEGLRSPQLD